MSASGARGTRACLSRTTVWFLTRPSRPGSGLGWAGFTVLDDSTSILQVAQAVARFLYVECSQCSACKSGLAWPRARSTRSSMRRRRASTTGNARSLRPPAHPRETGAIYRSRARSSSRVRVDYNLGLAVDEAPTDCSLDALRQCLHVAPEDFPKLPDSVPRPPPLTLFSQACTFQTCEDACSCAR